jgi:DNA-directed RNA polymerase specialized sigma24 family protein
MDLREAIESVDMDDIIDRLNVYALSRLHSVGIKNFKGRLPEDFVGDLILKIFEGSRDWNKANCSFELFLFGCLKSDIDNFFTTNKFNYTDTLPEVPIDGHLSSFEEERQELPVLLKKEGSDDEELIVFECWMEGMNKPAEIAADLGIDVKEVYRITKRLERRLQKIKPQISSLL